MQQLYRKILVPVDGDHPAQLREALRLATLCRAELCLLFVAEEAPAAPSDGPLGIRVLAAAAALAHRWCLAPEVTVVGRGSASVGEAIAAEARRWGADLVVVSHRSRGGRPDGPGSTVAEQVVSASTVPVLVIRSD